MTTMPGGTCVDRYEASAGTHGEAISVAGAMPWVSITYADAVTACFLAGKRLCTEAEWTVSCQPPDLTPYPYGGAYNPTACNGLDDGHGALVPTGSTKGCVGARIAVWDITGNAAELAAGCNNGLCPVLGGSYASPKDKLTCAAPASIGDTQRDPAVGFRCCH
jgi:formylglycine-generating enzyme required for sulfatase activity